MWLALNGALATAQADIANANLLFNNNHAGIAFNANYQNVSGNAAAVAAIGTGCANVANIQASNFYTANQLSDAIQPTTEHWRWWIVRERQVGWPARCFASAALETADSRNAGRVVTTSRVLRIGNLIPLPIGPLPFGFALNTLFYAALLWLLVLFAPRHARRGLCPACAYPVGESAVCSECGAPVRAVSE